MAAVILGVNVNMFILSVTTVVCLIHASLTLSLTSDVTPCQSVCDSTYQESDDASTCRRGCRLAAVIGSTNDAASMPELSKACLQSCAEAYGTVNASSCAFGCQSQMPSIEEKRNELVKYSSSEEAQEMRDLSDMLTMMSHVNDYYSRMMNCMMEHVQHQMTVGWMVISSTSLTSADGGAAGSGRVIVLRGVPVRIYSQERVVMQEIGTDDRSSSSDDEDDDDKDLISTTNVKISQQLYPIRSADFMTRDDRYEQKLESDWLSCVSNKTGLSRMSVVFLLFTMLVVVMWFVVCVVFPTSSKSESAPQKLSIYGDLEYLTTVDEKTPITFGSPTKYPASGYALPLPIKIMEI